jgi:hypothetical protein
VAEIINLLTAVRDKIGYESFIFIAFSFITIAFGEQLNDQIPSELEAILRAIAGILFAVGLLIAFLRVFHSFFTLRPARGMIDGFASGLVAGFIGGYFGYGSHSIAAYDIHPLLRMLLCVPFSIAVGGVLGLCIDLYHPDRKIPWRKYIGSIILSFAVLFSLVGFGIFIFVPSFSGAGIILSDIQLIFEVALVTMSAIIAFGFGWPLKKYIYRLLFIFFSIAVARIITHTVFIDNLNQTNFRLSQKQYVSGLEGGLDLTFSVIILMLWFIASYGLFYLDHPPARWLERLLTRFR